MKTKFLFMAALAAAVTFTSCSDDESESTAPSKLTSQEISFRVGIDNSKGTRATALTSSNYGSLMQNFTVFIQNASDGSQFAGSLYAPLVYFNDGNGAFKLGGNQETYYWPNSHLSFYAWSPANADGLGTTGGNVVYDVPADHKKQTDLLYASQTDIANDENNGVVDLQFRHVMTQINFKAGSVLKGHKVDIKDVSIAGLPAHLELNIVTGQVTTSGYSLYTMTCGASSGKDAVAHLSYGSEASPIDGEAKDWLGTSMLVPPCATVNEWDPKANTQPDNDDGFIAVTCKVLDTRTGKYVVGSESSFGKIYIPFSTIMEAGKSYNIVLNFNGEGGFGYDEEGNPTTAIINYSVSVADWQESGKGADTDI